ISHHSSDLSRAHPFPTRRSSDLFYPVGRYHYWAVGENLLYSSPDVDAPGAVKMWMESPEHRANILRKSWREVGLSAVHSNSAPRSEEHTSELQSRVDLVCRLLLE